MITSSSAHRLFELHPFAPRAQDAVGRRRAGVRRRLIPRQMMHPRSSAADMVAVVFQLGADMVAVVFQLGAR